MLRRSLLLLSLVLAVCSIDAVSSPIAEAAPPEENKAVISGVVRDSETDVPIENAIVILQCTCLAGQQERITNARGIYSFQDLPPGNYTIQVLAGKANTSKITQLPRGAKFRANFKIDPGNPDPQVIVVEAAPVSNSAAGSMTIGMEEAKALPVGSHTSRDFTAVVDLAPTASRDSAGIALGGTTGRNEWAPSPGTLTAGSLDDNRTRELISFAQTAYQCTELAQQVAVGPRAEIVVVDANGQPVQDAELLLSTSGSNQRTSLRTGTDGRAVVNGRSDLLGTDSARVTARAHGVEVSARVELGQGSQRLELPFDQTPAQVKVRGLDLVVVVDTTGSMSDELEWLTTELRSVVARALAEHPNIDVRLGVVAYRDIGDEYVTRRFELSSKHRDFQEFLANQVADGGGDTPEAVDAALLEASTFAWRHDQQVAKVVLLVGDAEPHDERVHDTFVATSSLRAAGVSIYPIASSGVGDQAELVFRSIAADSGAQYVFLTDHSGVGNPHAKPHAEDYDVELLEDVLLRILAAELSGSNKPGRAPKRAAKAFRLQRSLLDDGGARSLLGGPIVSFGLL